MKQGHLAASFRIVLSTAADTGRLCPYIIRQAIVIILLSLGSVPSRSVLGSDSCAVCSMFGCIQHSQCRSQYASHSNVPLDQRVMTCQAKVDCCRVKMQLYLWIGIPATSAAADTCCASTASFSGSPQCVLTFIGQEITPAAYYNYTSSRYTPSRRPKETKAAPILPSSLGIRRIPSVTTVTATMIPPCLRWCNERMGCVLCRSYWALGIAVPTAKAILNWNLKLTEQQ